jgi:WD40 repeat protein
MPIATRTFRVFVSSTFEDLKEERDALQRDVFPKLRTLCEQHGARFQAIDLRWGVRDESALDQKTMEICLREIERCQRTGIKPNFIVLLGQRYGWRPLPSRVEAGEFEAVLGRIEDGEDRALAESWYRRDDNAVPPEYLLKARVGESAQSERWQLLEARLHRILRDAAQAAGSSDDARVKFEASATHQEILKGLGATPEDRRHVFAFCRDASDKDCDRDLVDLKRVLHERLPVGNVLNYEPGDFAKLCQKVERTLRAVIESEAAGFESRSALALEIEAHDTFARERALVFGREDVLEGIATYLREGGPRPLVLHGPSGSGKSAVIAQASERASSAHTSAVVIRRFVGVSPESSSGLTLLRSLCDQVGEAYRIVGELPVDFNGVVRAFHERITQATSDRPLVFFLDALDQLGKDDIARSLTWLGGALPLHCRIVISTTDLNPALGECSILQLQLLPQPEAATALDHWFNAARRQLQPGQRERLLAAYGRCGLPLYLKLAFEEARGWASYQEPEECPLGDGIAGVIDSLLSRLSLEVNHGPLLINRGLGYLAAARYGLTEDEMLDVLSADEEVWRDFERRAHHTPSERRLPVIVWSRLFLDLSAYLAERSAPGGKVVSFYHNQFTRTIGARFLADNDRLQRHKRLAVYFARQSNWLDANRTVPNLRRVTEMVRHEIAAGMVDEAGATLTDLDFLSAKCCGGLVFDSQEDYRRAIITLPEAQMALQEETRRQAEVGRWTKEIIEYSRQWTTGEGRPRLPEMIRSVRLSSEAEIDSERQRIVENPTRLDRLRAFGGFVEQETYTLLEFGAHPGFLLQHAFNHSPEGPVHGAAGRALVAVHSPLMTRAWTARDRYNPKPALLRTLEGHTNVVRSISVTPDGRHAISASGDWTLRVWDLETGACLRVLEGHTADVVSASMTPDGLRAVSASDDRSVRLWNLHTGACQHVLHGHTERVTSVSVTPDGRRAVSGSWDKFVRVWNLETGQSLSTLEGHTDVIRSVSVSPDGRRAVSAGDDRSVRVWELDTGLCLRVLEGHADSVKSVTVTPDGRCAVSASDRTVRFWSLETGECMCTLETQARWVTCVSLTPDRRLAVLAADQTLQVWDVEMGACLRVLEGHGAVVESVGMTPDGRRAVSAGGWAKTVGLWDLEEGACQQVTPPPRAPSSWVNSLSVMPDGRRAVSARSDDTAWEWDLTAGEYRPILEGHTGFLWSACVVPDGRRVVSAHGGDKTVRVWDLDSGACVQVMEGHTEWITSVSVSRDCRRVVSASYDKTIRVWDLETGACLRVLEGHTDAVRSVSLVPDNQRVVSASADHTVRVWTLETGACLRVLEGHTDDVCSVSATPDGRRAVSCSDDRSVRLWDLQTGACLRVMKGHADRVQSVAVTPDGWRAASTGLDYTVRMWELNRGHCVAIVRLPSPGMAISFSSALGLGRLVVGVFSGDVLTFDLHGLNSGCEGVGACDHALDESSVNYQGIATCFLERLRTLRKRLQGRR